MAGRQDSAERRSGAFDAFDVARLGAKLSGTLDAASLPRTADRLVPGGRGAEVAWRIAGTHDALGRPALEIGLDGAVPLVCQRCLQPFAWAVKQRTVVLLARDERELAQLDADDEHEVVLAAVPLDAATLAEDELLLTLPFAPRCERAACVGKGPAPAAAARSAGGAPAFAALAALKGGGAKKGTK